MYNIAILGCENTHANTFLEFIKNDKDFTDVCVAGVYSDDIEAAKKLADLYGVNIMNRYDELQGKVDGVMVTARNGANHLKFIKPYLPYGVSVFVDKPVTISVAEAEEMMKCFKTYKNRFSGGSVMKYCDEIVAMKKELSELGADNIVSGFVKAPAMKNSPYGGLHFYAPHLVEIMCELYGRFPESISAVENEDCITAIFRYKSYDITAAFTEMRVSSNYYALCSAKEKTFLREVNIEQKDFREEFSVFYKSLKYEVDNPDEKEFISPVYILNTVEKALKSGKEEKILWQ